MPFIIVTVPIRVGAVGETGLLAATTSLVDASQELQQAALATQSDVTPSAIDAVVAGLINSNSQARVAVANLLGI